MPFPFFGTPSPPSLPAACSQCVQTLIGPQSGGLPVSSAIAQFRSLEGMIRVDCGNISLITNPITGVRILLNNLTQEARMLLRGGVPGGLPQMPTPGAIPGLPGFVLAAPSLAASMSVATLIQLGKSMIEGQAVEGVLHVFPVTLGMLPPTLTSWEVWASSKLKLPVMTKSIGSFGQITTICRCSPVPPSPAMFQIPPGYSVVTPTSRVPATPALPNIPGQIPRLP